VHVVVRDESQGIEAVGRRMSVDEFVARFRFRPRGMSTDLARTYSVTVTIDVVDRIVTCQHTSVCADGKWGDPTTTRYATDHNRRTERVYSAGTSGGGFPTTQEGQTPSTTTIQRAINSAKEAMAPYVNRLVDEQGFCSAD
jgi:Tfp pilus assembly protein PilW